MSERRELPILNPTAAAAAREERPHSAYWRSVSEALGGVEPGPSPEFPRGADEPPSPLSRRDFVKLVGASAALAGLYGCVEGPAEKILPYVVQPPEITPGAPLSYASTMTLDGFGRGVLIRTREGRPIKVEGNPTHPASLGAADAFAQASVLGLYDPYRLRSASRGAKPAGWQDFVRGVARSGPGDGAGLHLVLEPTASPLRASLIRRVREALPAARFWFHSATPAAPVAARSLPLPDFAAAEVIVAFDDDFAASGPWHLAAARGFAEGRRLESPEGRMSRFYAVESAPTPTGTLADHRLRAKSGEVPMLLALLARRLGAPAPGNVAALADAGERRFGARVGPWLDQAARDLQAHRGRSIVTVGAAQPPAAHALARLINDALGNTGRTVRWVANPLVDAGEPTHSLVPLAAELRSGRVDRLVILDGDPVRTTPRDLGLAEALPLARESVYFGVHRTATARVAAWRMPLLHYMEAWGDARAVDGTVSPVQPVIRPLFGGHSIDDVLLAFAGADPARTAHDALLAHWRDEVAPAHGAGSDFRTWWEDVLRRGVVEGSASPAGAAPPDAAAELAALDVAPPPEDAIEIALRPDARVHDGRFVDTTWLLELPEPTTKQVWGNAAWMSPATAAARGLGKGDVVELSADGTRVRAGVLPVPGHADGCVTLHLGYGQEGEGPGGGVGFDAYAFARVASPWLVERGTLRRLDGERVRLVTTQEHWRLHDRAEKIVAEATLEEYRKKPDFTEEQHQRGELETLYHAPPDHERSGPQWAMSIDLSVCTGCSACVVACVAENNIPMVGADQVARGREMHWLRIDRYHEGSVDEPSVINQPMLCQHCEKAPCEYVCPVNATVHSEDGLNEMVYNRCVGTRFCSNNCPYKVRRFNWLEWRTAPADSPEMLVLNPDVTVRERGVMEKCTYCVQRIRRAQITAKLEDRELEDGEVVTACQQACPTRAITFGSLTHEGSELARTREQHRRFFALHELGEKPRTMYLARITNPNPELG